MSELVASPYTMVCICHNGACSREFFARIRDVQRGRGLFCSRHCHSVSNARTTHLRHSMAGADNPNFKGWASRNKVAYKNRFRVRNPEKARAHDIVRNALASGKLVRPPACERCGTVGKTQAHHDDYSRPLDVRFVCRKVCHPILDAERQLRERAATWDDRIALKQRAQDLTVQTQGEQGALDVPSGAADLLGGAV